MTLQAGFDKGLQGDDLGNYGLGCCTHRYTQVEIDERLVSVIIAWPSLSDQQREAFSKLAIAVRRDLR